MSDYDSSLRRAYWLTFISGFFLIVIYGFQAYYPHFMTVLSNVFPLLIAGTAVIVSSFALRSYWQNLESKLSRIWLGFALGMAFWFLGEVSWTIYTLVLNISVPYPSIADIYRLVGYGFLFFAILTHKCGYNSVPPFVSQHETNALESSYTACGFRVSSSRPYFTDSSHVRFIGFHHDKAQRKDGVCVGAHQRWSYNERVWRHTF
jgi:hypothetical protein